MKNTYLWGDVREGEKAADEEVPSISDECGTGNGSIATIELYGQDTMRKTAKRKLEGLGACRNDDGGE